jgi:hypothetical protein
MVSLRTASTNPGRFEHLIEFKPRSEIAKFMDFVKFNGVVEGSRRSTNREMNKEATIAM